MLLNIHDNLLLEDIQDQFSDSFPSLKIEFYRHAHHRKEGSTQQDQIDAKTRVSDIRKRHNPGVLLLKSTDTTYHVESMFKDIFGLNVQIFRKGKNGWIQTIPTDNYSLQQQSELSYGGNISFSMELEQEEDENYFL